jgi:hypothetical protein
MLDKRVVSGLTEMMVGLETSLDLERIRGELEKACEGMEITEVLVVLDPSKDKTTNVLFNVFTEYSAFPKEGDYSEEFNEGDEFLEVMGRDCEVGGRIVTLNYIAPNRIRVMFVMG